MEKTLNDVQVGDLVIINTRTDKIISGVDRITNTQIVVGLNKFSKKDGDRVGNGDWDIFYISLPQDGEIEQIKAENSKSFLVGILSNIKWQLFSLEQLTKIGQIIYPKAQKKYKKPKEI